MSEYLEKLPPDRRAAVKKLTQTIRQNLDPDFDERMSYGMIGFVVPHEIFLSSYHCDPKLPLPFLNIASQKNFIALYHMGMYADKSLLDWFVVEYPKHCSIWEKVLFALKKWMIFRMHLLANSLLK